jgi:hypothetical protein
LFGQAVALVPTGPGTFRSAEGPITDRAFLETPGGGMVYATGGDYWERASLVPVVLRIVVLALALALMLAAILYAVGWIPRRLLGKVRGRPATAVRLWPFLAVVSGIGFVMIAIRYGLSDGGTFNLGSGAMFVASLQFPLVSLVALMISLRAASEAGPRARRFGILVSVACLAVVVWLGSYGFIGLRTWRY